jgi:hypothetical protein
MKRQERVIATIRKGKRNTIVLSISERDQQPCLAIRQHEPNGLRVLVPTSNIDPAAARELIAAIENALVAAGEVRT